MKGAMWSWSRIAAVWVFLASWSLAQDEKPRHIALREKEEAAQRALAQQAAALESESLAEPVATAEVDFDLAEQKLAQLRQRYDAPDIDEPSRDEVLREIRRLNELIHSDNYEERLDDIDARIDRYEDLRDEAEAGIDALEFEFPRRVQRARAAFKREDGGNWEAEDAKWAALSESRSKLLRTLRSRAQNLLTASEKLGALEEQTQTTYGQILYLLRVENLFLRMPSGLTETTLDDGLEDLGELPGWLEATAESAATYVTHADHRGALLFWIGGIVLAAVLLLLARRAIRRYEERHAESDAETGPSAGPRILRAIATAAVVYWVAYSITWQFSDLSREPRHWFRAVALILGSLWLASSLFRELFRPGAPETAVFRAPAWAVRRLWLGMASAA